MILQTEFKCKLQKGYIDEEGTIHKEVTMKLARASDVILPLKDHRVQSNPAYLNIILLSRVITKLGTLNSEMITPKVIEQLFVEDLSLLQSFYEKINGNGSSKISTICPKCENKFEMDLGNPE
jgi:hypothetical protein